MRQYNSLEINRIGSIEDTITSYSVIQSNISKTQLQMMKDSRIDFSVVIENQDSNKKSLFGKSNSQFFKLRQEMAIKLHQIMHQNEELKRRNKSLQNDKVQMKKEIEKYYKENCPTKRKSTQFQAKDNQQQKISSNKNQLQLKIGSLKLQLQRQARQKEMIVNSFNQQKSNMLEQLNILKMDNQDKDGKLRTLNEQIIQLQEKLIKSYNQIQQLKGKLNTTLSKTPYEQKNKKSFSQSFCSSISGQMKDESQYNKFLIQQLIERAATLFEDNAVISQKNRSVSKVNESLKIKVKLIQNQNKQLMGKLQSYQVLIQIQKDQLANMIKMHDSELKERMEIQSRHLEKKHQFYKTEIQTLKSRNAELSKNFFEVQALYKGKIIELQKYLVQALLPRSQQNNQAENFKTFCGDLYSNLFSQCERLTRQNTSLKGQFGGSQTSKKNAEAFYIQKAGRIFRQSTENSGKSQSRQELNIIQKIPVNLLGIKNVDSSCQGQEIAQKSEMSSNYSYGTQSCVPTSPVTKTNCMQQNHRYFAAKTIEG